MGPAGKALSTESVEDRNALRDYYRCILEDVNPPEGKLSVLAKGHWMSRSTLAKWHGITINGSGRIVEVDIPYPFKGSEGTWSERNKNAIDQDAFAELTSLDQLQVLNIGGNFLQILIEPGTFDNLQQLRSLDLYGNLILPESNFSEFRKLTSLEHLSLSIPVGASAEALCGLTSLKSLDLHLQGTSTIPACLGNLTNLESLSLSGGYFDFSGIWNSSSFQSIYDHDEACPNPIYPDPYGLFILNCASYKERTFDGVVIQAADSLALSSLQNLTGLKRLSLTNMGLTGIPAWIGALTELEELHIPVGYYMSGNPLTGPLPPGLGQLTKIKTLRIIASGPLPPEIGDMESLESLSITGPYSDSGARKIEEEGRLLSDNTQHIGQHYSTKFTLEEIEMLLGLDGPLPPEWGKLSNLKHLGLTGYLSGQLPPEWSGMTSLESLGLSDLEAVLKLCFFMPGV